MYRMFVKTRDSRTFSKGRGENRALDQKVGKSRACWSACK